MPDLAKVQDDLGTVHFSRLHGRGRREASLPLRYRRRGRRRILSGSWRVLARCSTPSSSTWTTLRQRVATRERCRQVAEGSCPRASRHVLRVRGRFGSGRQGVRTSGGLHRQHLAEPLADIHDPQVKPAGLASKVDVAGVLAETRRRRRRTRLGRCTSAHWVPFEDNHLGFFTIFDGDFEKYIQDFADKTSFTLRRALPACRRRAAHPGREERPGVLSVGMETTIRRSGSTAPIPASRCTTFEPCSPIATPQSTAELEVDRRLP